jgi:hypothetical protein
MNGGDVVGALPPGARPHNDSLEFHAKQISHCALRAKADDDRISHKVIFVMNSRKGERN